HRRLVSDWSSDVCSSDLGARLGPDWTAPAVLAWLTKTRTQPLLDAPHDPLAYLAAVLDQALTGDNEPPHPARRHTEHRRQLAAEIGRASCRERGYNARGA